MRESAYDVFAQANADRIAYFRYWTHDAPMVVSSARDAELNRVQRALAACARHYAACYGDYLDRIGYDDATLAALELVRDVPYELGTFRPDYVICDDGSLRVCEITSRFFGNGYFYSFFMDGTGRELARQAGIDDYTSYIGAMLEYFARMAEGKDELVILQSSDRSDSIPLYTPFYRALGLEVTAIDAPRVNREFRPRATSLVVSALNQADLLALSRDSLKRYVECGARNDLRSVLLLHDKRVLSLLFDDAFCAGCLDADDTSFLRDHVVRTYAPGERPDVWEDARASKDGYIVKPSRLGKSEGVMAGCLCDGDEWARLFEGATLDDAVLQPFMDQRVYPAVWKGDAVEEYICGTILCVDDEYFGTGYFRSSLRPVVNTGDDSKVAPLVTDSGDDIAYKFVL